MKANGHKAFEDSVPLCVWLGRYCGGKVAEHVYQPENAATPRVLLMCAWHGRLWPTPNEAPAQAAKRRRMRMVALEPFGFSGWHAAARRGLPADET